MNLSLNDVDEEFLCPSIHQSCCPLCKARLQLCRQKNGGKNAKVQVSIHEPWQNRNPEISQQRRQRSKITQWQLIFNGELTPELDSQHLRTAGEGRVLSVLETT